MKMNTPCWSDEQLEAIAQGIRHTREWCFFAAHERFEEAWKRAGGQERAVLRGLVQLVASHHQLTLGRGTAAIRTWHKARAHLEGLPIETLCAAMDALHRELGLSRDGPRFFDARALAAYQSLPMLDAATLHTPSA